MEKTLTAVFGTIVAGIIGLVIEFDADIPGVSAMIDHLVSELRVYDITSGAYEVLASGTDLVASERGKMCYGNVIVYDLLDHDTGESALWLYDLYTTQSVCIARDNWIVEYVILDGKVIYNVSQLDGN